MKMLIAALAIMATPAAAQDCSAPDTADLAAFIQKRIGADTPAVADWIARQSMNPEILREIVRADPILAAAIVAYDGSTAALRAEGCDRATSLHSEYPLGLPQPFVR